MLPPPFDSRTTLSTWNQEWNVWAATTLAENAGYWKPILGSKFRPPRIRFLHESAIDTGCGSVDTEAQAMYCPFDETIYVDALFLQEQESAFGAHAALADGIVDLTRCQLTGDGHYYPATQL